MYDTAILFLHPISIKRSGSDVFWHARRWARSLLRRCENGGDAESGGFDGFEIDLVRNIPNLPWSTRDMLKIPVCSCLHVWSHQVCVKLAIAAFVIKKVVAFAVQ